MSNRKITQLTQNTNPTLSDVFPIVNNNVTKKLSLNGLVDFLSPYLEETIITGGTYSASAETATFTNNTGGTFSVTGITNGNIKKWNESELIEIGAKETILISGNYVLIDSFLNILNDNNIINVGPISFEKKGELYIGGNAFFEDTTINNDGIISIAGALILSENTIITGTGILI
jgi:hypothetical protein